MVKINGKGTIVAVLELKVGTYLKKVKNNMYWTIVAVLELKVGDTY